MSNVVCICGADSWGFVRDTNITLVKVLNTNCFNCKVSPFCYDCMKTKNLKPSPNQQQNKTPLRCANNDCRKEYM